MGRRTLLLIAALVVAGLGTLLIFVYVQNIESEHAEGEVPVEVLVATQEVPAGTTAGEAAESGAFEKTEVPREDAAPGALSDIQDISDQSTNATIYAGQQILAQMFTESGGNSPLTVPKGQLAVSVQLGDPERVAGFVVPGSRVAVFGTLPQEGGGEFTQALLPEVEVIGVGATTLSTQTTTTDEGESTTEEIPLAILTLSVTQQEAQKLINAQSGGALYFGLLGEGTRVRATGPTTTQNLFR